MSCVTFRRPAEWWAYRVTPIAAADLLNDRVLPFYQEHEVALLRILTDRGSEYCGKVEQHEYQLYLAVNDIDHTRTQAQSPQTNGICERFHKKILNEFYQVAFRKKIYATLEELQEDLDVWIVAYNHERRTKGKCAVAERRWPHSRTANESVERRRLCNLI